MKIRLTALLLLSLSFATPLLQAQTGRDRMDPPAYGAFRSKAGRQEPKTGAVPCPAVVSEKTFFKNLWCDQKAIWSSPFHASSYRARFLLPLAGSTAVLFATDPSVARNIVGTPPGTAYDVGKGVSLLGSAPAVLGVSGAVYGIARLRHDDRMRDAALLAFEALADSGIVQGVLKVATMRERPASDDGRTLIDEGRGRFWAGGTSFPSGHAMSSWSLAVIFASRYREKPLIKYGAYGLAAAVSISRIPARRHFPSDVLVGSVLGYLIGRHVARPHPW